MSVAKVTGILTRRTRSFEHAINVGLERANATLDTIEGAWTKDMKVSVGNGKVQSYCVNPKQSFIVH